MARGVMVCESGHSQSWPKRPSTTCRSYVGFATLPKPKLTHAPPCNAGDCFRYASIAAACSACSTPQTSRRKAAASFMQAISVNETAARRASEWHQHMTDNPTRAPRVLIIENDFLIGEMLHDMVADLGYAVTKVAHQLPSALDEISKENFDGALVNIGIDEQKHGSEIADILLAKNIPFAFVTGYGHALEQRHAGIPLLQKPFNIDQLRMVLEAIIGPGGSPHHTASHAA